MFDSPEQSRLVVALKVKKGPVRDIAFSTRKPAELMSLLGRLTVDSSLPPGSPAIRRTGL